MSGAGEVRIVILWEHELRLAAEKLFAVRDLMDSEGAEAVDDDTVSRAMAEAHHACEMALYHVHTMPTAPIVVTSVNAAKIKQMAKLAKERA